MADHSEVTRESRFRQDHAPASAYIALPVAALLVMATAVAAGQWTDWQWINPRPQGNDLRDVASGNGIAVAVGRGGTVLRSLNGEPWELVRSGRDEDLEAVEWTGERFVAVGGASPSMNGSQTGVVLSSEDGRVWTERARIADGDLLTFTDVLWNGRQVLVVGAGLYTMTSPEGLAWTAHRLSPALGAFPGLQTVAWSGSSYLSVGRIYWDQGLQVLFTSSDGADWMRLPADDLASFDVNAVAFGAGRYVAVGGLWPDAARIAISADGVSWNPAPANLPHAPWAIVFQNGRFVATGGNGMIAFSNDGEAWVAETTTLSKSLRGVGWIGDRFLVVGDDGIMATTADGASWEVIYERDIDIGQAKLVDMTREGDTVVGVTNGGSTITSVNGQDWIIRNNSGQGLLSAKSLRGSFWAVGVSGTVMRSPDGLSWDEQQVEGLTRVTDVADDGRTLVALGWSAETSPRVVVVTSTTGDSWVIHNQSGLEDAPVSLTWMGGRFVAVGARGTVALSNDGLSWACSSVGEGVTFRRLVSNGQVIVAVGDQQAGGVVATSPDGQSWEVHQVPDLGLDDVTWTGQHFVALGGRYLLTSRDGTKWTVEPIGYGLRADCLEGDGATLITAGTGAKMVSAVNVAVAPRRPRERVH